jgi:hypothetical protein
MIEFFAYASYRSQFVAGMTNTLLPDGTPLCTLAEDGETLIPVPGVSIDEIGPVTKTPAVIDKDGNEVTPAVVITGHHANIRVTGPVAELLANGMPTEGDVFQRTRLLNLVPGMVEKPAMAKGVPAGYVGPNGVRLFDPVLVTTPYRIWL